MRISDWSSDVCSSDLVSGFTSFTAHAGGPPVNVYLLPLGLPKTQYQATTVAFFLLVNYGKLIPYTGLGLFTGENLATSAALFPVAVAGILSGRSEEHTSELQSLMRN